MLLDDQVPPETVDENVTPRPIQVDCPPDNVPAEGAAVTVTGVVVVAFAQPPDPLMVYKIFIVPAVKPETTPEEFTAAIEVFELDQVPPEILGFNVEVLASQTNVFPVIVATVVGAVTVTVAVVVAFAQPPVPVIV